LVAYRSALKSVTLQASLSQAKLRPVLGDEGMRIPKRAFAIAMIAIVGIGSGVAQTVGDRFKSAFSAMERNDYAAAAEIFRSLAEEGNRAAQFNLGHMYLQGNQPKNYSEAAKWLVVPQSKAIPCPKASSEAVLASAGHRVPAS